MERISTTSLPRRITTTVSESPGPATSSPANTGSVVDAAAGWRCCAASSQASEISASCDCFGNSPNPRDSHNGFPGPHSLYFLLDPSTGREIRTDIAIQIVFRQRQQRFQIQPLQIWGVEGANGEQRPAVPVDTEGIIERTTRRDRVPECENMHLAPRADACDRVVDVWPYTRRFVDHGQNPAVEALKANPFVGAQSQRIPVGTQFEPGLAS